VPTVLDVLRPSFDWRAVLALPVDELDRLRTLPGLMGPIHVRPGHGCVVFTAHRYSLVAAGLVNPDQPWPGDPGVGSAPRWVQRVDGRRCALSFLQRRKVGAHRVVIGRLAGELASE